MNKTSEETELTPPPPRQPGGVSQLRWFADKLTSLKGGYWLARNTSRQDGSQRATTSAKPSGLGPVER